MRQTQPVLTYGYQVVTTRAQYQTPSIAYRLFSWTRPFSAGVWGVLAASLVAAAIYMPIFELNGGDFNQDALHSAGEVAGHGAFWPFPGMSAVRCSDFPAGASPPHQPYI